MLAGIMQSPTNYNPAEQPEKNLERAKLVLDAMVETGAIRDTDRARALSQSPKVWKTAPTAPAQYFVDWLDGQMQKVSGLPKQDLVVETTLDLPAEQAAADAAKATVARYAKQKVAQAAIVTLDGSGRIRAMIGGVDYSTSPFNRAVDAHRQAGSSWKPFVYLTAMEAGRTPDDMVVDEPVTIANWTPHNFEEGYLGSITLEHALAESINTVAARLADEIGRPQVAATAKRLGIVSPINTDPAMALGTTLVTPLEMAGAYAAFGNGGAKVLPYGVERVRAVGGGVVFQHRPVAPQPVIANPALGEVDRMMRTVVASGTGTRAAIPGYDLAGKTGTTSDYKDAWFDGFTGGLTTVVWMGRDDAQPMRKITGGIAPAELWHNYMAVALKRLPSTAIPPGAPPPDALPIPVNFNGPSPNETAAPAPGPVAGPAPGGAGSGFGLMPELPTRR